MQVSSPLTCCLMVRVSESVNGSHLQSGVLITALKPQFQVGANSEHFNGKLETEG